MGVDLTAIDGIEAHTALVILGEIGVDVSKFPTEKHFASWLGLCPNRQESNRKRKSRRVRKGGGKVPGGDGVASGGAVAATLTLGAGGYFRRRNSRLGFQGAVTATAHKLARYVSAILEQLGVERPPGSMVIAPFPESNRERSLKRTLL
jgi:transposase